jgi:hypothetical protein
MQRLREVLRRLGEVARNRQKRKHEKLVALKRAEHQKEIAKRKRKAQHRLTKVRAKLRHRAEQIRSRLKPQFHPSYLNGHPGNISDNTEEVIAYAVGRFHMVVTATTDGTHAPGSWHYEGRAVDLWHSSVSTMIAFQNFAAGKWPNALEIFGPDDFYIKDGRRYAGAFPDHGDHDHVAR